MNRSHTGGGGSGAQGSRVPSPSLDSGRGSSSTPSSPIKELSPIPLSTPFKLPMSPNSSSKSSPQKEDLPVISAKSYNIRQDSLEDDEDISLCMNKSLKPQNASTPTPTVSITCTSLAMDDLNVPNEVFTEQTCVIEHTTPLATSLLAPNINKEIKIKVPHIGKNISEHCQIDSSNSLNATEKEIKSVLPMAFTIELDNGPKKFGITDSISKYAPKNFRNSGGSLSSYKIEKKSTRDEQNCLRKATAAFPVRLRKIDIDKSIKNSKLSKSPTSDSNVSKTSQNNSILFDKQIEPWTNKEISYDVSIEKELNKDSKRNSISTSDSIQRLLPKSLQMERNIMEPNDQNVTDINYEERNNFPTKPLQKSEPISCNYLVEKATKGGKVLNEEEKLEEASGTASETGTYTIENEDHEAELELQTARKSIDNVFGMHPIKKQTHANTPTPSPAMQVNETPKKKGSMESEWIREWAEKAAFQQEINKTDKKTLSDTHLFLQDTQTVVNAMQERMRSNLSNDNTDDSEDEETLSYTPKKSNQYNKPKLPVPISPRRNPLPREMSVMSDSGFHIGYQSDNPKSLREYGNMGSVKGNKVFSNNSNVVGYESDGSGMAALNRNLNQRFIPTSYQNNINSVPGNSNNTVGFVRNDGGRYSLRMPKSKGTPYKMLSPPTTTQPHSSPQIKLRPSLRAPTNTKSKVEPIPKYTNSYYKPKQELERPLPPMPSTQTRKPPPPPSTRSNSTLTAKEVELANWKRRKSYDPMRAAAEARDKRKGFNESPIQNIPNDDISSCSSPMHYSELDLTSRPVNRGRSCSRCSSAEEEDEFMFVYATSDFERSQNNSPIHIPRSNSINEDPYYCGLSSISLRPKNKLEALDNLVIATIHSLSNKVRISSRQLLEKLQVQHAANENGALLEEMISQLRELEISSSNASSPNKSPSRELSGTLKNLKKLEEVILVLDRVLCDDTESNQT